jgi:hypothetical protein
MRSNEPKLFVSFPYAVLYAFFGLWLFYINFSKLLNLCPLTFQSGWYLGHPKMEYRANNIGVDNMNWHLNEVK